MIPLPVIFAAVAAVAGFTGAWTFQENRYERKLSELRTEYAAAQVRAVEKAHAETIRLQERKDKAERLAAVRQSDLRRDLAANLDALGRLSHAADSALRGASASHEACVATATAQGVVLNQCGARLVEVAANADGHTSDIQTLTDSWPTGSD